jgi:hypothetical protein
MQKTHPCRNFIFLLLVVLLPAVMLGCSATPAEEVVAEEVLLETDFSSRGEWPEKEDMEAGTAVQFTNGGYELRSASDTYVLSFAKGVYEDVELETAVRQLSPERNNAFGLVCRAGSRDSRSGYYFLISGDGLVSIRREERGFSSPIVDWTPKNAVRQGDRTNQLRAICVGDYLALYVNNQLVAEGMDDHFTQGLAGFAANGSEDGSVQVSFDNFTIRAAKMNRQ